MSVAENWQAPDWFTARAESQADLRVVIVDGTPADEQQLLRVARAAGIDCPWDHWSQTNSGSAALLLELRAEFAAAVRCLRALRADRHFAAMPLLCAVSPELLPQIEAAIVFDDFVLQPANPLEVRSRIRVIEQRRQTAEPESVPESAVDSDGIEVDPIAHEALVEGRTIRLTAREFALFAYLRARRGRVLSRELLLSRVWGQRYQGGPRTVDTHIGRLRSKFGGALPIETVRSNGYRLRDSSLGASAAE
jgi:two-component system alkaline phosphatase synthesis response regulator PhoP